MVGMAVGNVKHEDIGPGLQERARTLNIFRFHPNRRADAQTTALILGCFGMFTAFDHILCGDQANQITLAVDQR